MVNDRAPKKVAYKDRPMQARRARIVEEQKVQEIYLELTARTRVLPFENGIHGMYGIHGVGKSRFLYELGEALKEKYSLAESGVYVVQGEDPNHTWALRGTKTRDRKTFFMKTWPTLQKFVNAVTSNPEFVKTVKMWAIDTVDGLHPKLESKVCHDFDIVHPQDEGWANAYKEMAREMEYQILRLRDIGPGVLLVSHERYREEKTGVVVEKKAFPDLSPGMFNAVSNTCSTVMRMRQNRIGSKKGKRYLTVVDSMQEYGKDNLNKVRLYNEGRIDFDTEREAVDKLLACFRSAKTSKKKKSSKKKVMRHS